jgi:prepilin-type N-terminal cleavage/methylation domain-containing protein
MKSEKAFTLIELMVVVVIIGILAAIAIPNFLRMQTRAKESDVKSVAHAVLLAVEEYKTYPLWATLKPINVTELGNSGGISQALLLKKNPLNPIQNYTPGSALVDGIPGGDGHVGYEFTGQTNPYTVYARGSGQIVLTLSGES